MGYLTQYYQGILQNLRFEVDSINTLFHHQGLKGGGNETRLRDLIKEFIPKRYAVGTGVVIDSHGNQSRQCDIIIHDSFLYPSLLSLSEVHFYPVDIVYATIEVKTTLDANAAKEARRNIASVRDLDLIPDQFTTSAQRGGAYSLTMFTPTPPLGFVFAYNTDVLPETILSWFTSKNEENTSDSPTLVCSLDQGILCIRQAMALWLCRKDQMQS